MSFVYLYSPEIAAYLHQGVTILKWHRLSLRTPFDRSRTKFEYCLCVDIIRFSCLALSIGKGAKTYISVSFAYGVRYFLVMQYVICFEFSHTEVTEFIDGGDLQQLWHQTGWFDEDLVRLYIGELALILGKNEGCSSLCFYEFMYMRLIHKGKIGCIVNLLCTRLPTQCGSYLQRFKNGEYFD